MSVLVERFHMHKHELRPFGLGLAAILVVTSPIWLVTLVTWGDIFLGVMIWFLAIFAAFALVAIGGLGHILMEEVSWFKKFKADEYDDGYSAD